MDTAQIISWLLNFIGSRTVSVPDDFHGRAKAVHVMLQDDCSGLVDTLTDFSVQSASVDFSIETNSERLNELFKDWLNHINASYNGKIPMGIKSIAKEYYKERWKGSSFPILRIAKWGKIPGSTVIFPTQMYIVDGKSVYAKEKDSGNNLTPDKYEYYIGSDVSDVSMKLDKDVIITNPYGRVFEDYPTPFLIKRGIYRNWKIMDTLKRKQGDLLDQIIPYMLQIKMGSPEMLSMMNKTYSDQELIDVASDLQSLVTNMQDMVGSKQFKSPIHASNFDKVFEHLIPDLESMFKTVLFEEAERNILAGLGMVDIVQGTSSTRRESVLNPKPFMQEVVDGVEGFKDILRQLLYIIKEKNGSHIKYINEDYHISNSPIKSFADADFKGLIRSLYDKGVVSKRTAVEIIGDCNFDTEVFRREQESKSGMDYVMYPPVIVNQENSGIDVPGDTEKVNNKENIPDDKKGTEKNNYNNASEELFTAPYTKITDLPENVKEKLDRKEQKKWMDIWNSAYKYAMKKWGDEQKAESYAFRVAWSKVRSKRG